MICGEINCQLYLTTLHIADHIRTFANTNELFAYAEQFINEKVAALEKDVKHYRNKTLRTNYL